MSFLDDVKWENGEGLNDFIAFGIGPARKFADMVFEETAGNINRYPDELSFFSLAVLDYLDDMEKCIYRFIDANQTGIRINIRRKISQLELEASRLKAADKMIADAHELAEQYEESYRKRSK